MAQAGYTPIQLYYSTTAAAVPLAANLAAGELAINIVDGKLYYENNSGVVTLLASAAGASGDVVGPASATNNALARFDGTTGKLIKDSSALTFDGTSLTFTSTGQRIIADMSSATITNRLAFQTSTTNSSTVVGAIPNGTSNVASFLAYNNSDPTNASNGGILTTATEIRLQSGISGTGTYLPLTFYTNGAERGRFDTAGNFGIGTSSPSTFGKLSVYGNGTAPVIGAFLGSNSPASGATLADIAFGSRTDGTVTALIRAIANDNGNGTDGQLTFWTADNTASAAATEKMRITSAGDVGIGTSSPARKLQVNSGEAVAARFTRGGGIVANNSLEWFDGTNGWYAGVSGSNFWGVAYNSSGGIDSAAIRLDTSGNLGLGVTPSAWRTGLADRALDVGETTGLYYQTGGTTVLLNNAYRGAGNTIRYKITGAAQGYWQDSGQHYWTTAPSGTAGNAITFTQAMTLDASGRLGIGTTSTSSGKTTISLAGVVVAGNTDGATVGNSGVVNLFNNNGGTTNSTIMLLGSTSDSTVGQIASGIGFSRENTGDWGTQLRFYTHSTSTADLDELLERARITSSGNLGIGTTVPNAKLTVWTPSTTGLQTALRLNNPFGFDNANTGAQIVFSQDRTTAEDLPQGIIAVGQGNAGTSAESYMAFYTNSTGVTEKVRISSTGNLYVGTTTSNNMGGTKVQTLGGSGIIDSSGTVAQNGTVTVTANAGGSSFTGFLSVSNVYSLNAAIRTQTLYAIMGRGTTFTATQLASANGPTSGASFTVTCPSNGVITITNTYAGTTLINATYIGNNGG